MKDEDNTFNFLKYRRYSNTELTICGIHVDANSFYWVNDNGDLHKLDGPAYISNDGYKAWLVDGYLHREDGPAEEYPDGSIRWWRYGIFVNSENSKT